MQKRPPGTANTEAGSGTDHHGHSHERGKMLLVDVGSKYHALLTAHLSPQGNELDIFFETPDDKNPKPAAVSVQSLTAYITLAGEDKARDVVFGPAPPDERPKGEGPQACSHFVAQVPWMKAGDNLTVVVRVAAEGETYRITWQDFNSKKYAHHDE